MDPSTQFVHEVYHDDHASARASASWRNGNANFDLPEFAFQFPASPRVIAKVELAI